MVTTLVDAMENTEGYQYGIDCFKVLTTCTGNGDHDGSIIFGKLKEASWG